MRHLGLGASANFYTTQNNVWGHYLNSLEKLAETGKGDPFKAAGREPRPRAW